MADDFHDDETFPAIDDGHDDHLDRLIGDRLRQSIAPSDPADDPVEALATLQPRFTRARRARRAGLAASVVAPAAVVVVGALMLVPGLSFGGDGQATVAGQPEPTTASAGDDEGADRPTIEVTGTTAGEGERAAGDDAGGDGGESEGDADEASELESSVADATSASTPTSIPTSTVPPSTSRSTTTASTGVSTSLPGSSIVESDCGSIVIRVVGSEVELLETRPDPGYGTDVKSSGPEVEVSFEGRRGHCELEAKWRDGRLVTSDDEDGRQSP